jgi:plasmid stabilization system protein ParE
VKHYTVVATPHFRRQSRDFYLYYSDQADVETARRFAVMELAAVVSLNTFPKAHQFDEQIRCRRIHVRAFPVVIWFDVNDEQQQVQLLAITHNRMSGDRIRRSLSDDY